MAARQVLVKNAIVHLRKRKGATLAQIQQQLESSYSGKVDVKNKKMLTTALKGLVKKGQVEKQGANYKLARVAKLSNDEEEYTVPSRHHRRRHPGGGASRRGRHHRSRLHHRRQHHSRQGRHHSRRRKHHSRRKSKHRRR